MRSLIERTSNWVYVFRLFVLVIGFSTFGQFSMQGHTTNMAGGTTSGGTYVSTVSIGEFAATPLSSGGTYDHFGGFTGAILGDVVFIGVIESDSLALVALYNATGGASWTNSDNWLVGNVGSWFGVKESGSRVVKVNLFNNNLVGTLPAEIGDLSAVTRFELSTNSVSGSIPTEIGLMISLDSLGMSSNPISGSIPESLYDLTSLVRLSISQAQLTGSISPNIQKLTNLKHIALWGNPMNGDIPAEFWNMTAMVNIYIGTSDLSGIIPAQIANMSNLKEFWIDNCNISSSIPAEVGELTALELFHVGNTQLSGAIPSEMTNLVNLTSLELDKNQFTNLPDLSSLIGLTNLKVDSNFFTFKDLIPNAGITGFVYEPQKPIAPATYDTAYVGIDIVLDQSSLFTHVDNVYQWKLNNADLPSATQNSYTVSAVDYSKMGEYKLSVTNPGLPSLTIESDTMNVFAKGDLTVSVIDINDNPIGSGKGAVMKLAEELGVAYDTTNVVNFLTGDFDFTGVVLDDYLVGVESDDPLQLETYYSNTFLWEEADTLEMRERNQAITLRIIEQPDELTSADGDGELSGYLEIEVPDEEGRLEGRRRVKNTRCHVRRNTGGGRGLGPTDNYVLIASLDTDENGEFTIEFLPVGMYRINFEFPGVPMDENSFVEFEITEVEDEITIAATIDNGLITIEEIMALGIYQSFLKDFKVYPNPTMDVLTVTFRPTKSTSPLEVRMFDQGGRLIFSNQVKGQNQAYKEEINMSELKSGIYILKVGEVGGKLKYGYRVLKK